MMTRDELNELLTEPVPITHREICDAIMAHDAEQRVLIEELTKKYQALVKFYDDHNGTPCEQIRWAETVGKMNEIIAEQRAEIERLQEMVEAYDCGVLHDHLVDQAQELDRVMGGAVKFAGYVNDRAELRSKIRVDAETFLTSPAVQAYLKRQKEGA